MLKTWARIWAIALLLWTLLAILSAAGTRLYMASTGSPERWSQVLAWYLLISVVWSFLTPPVYFLARRYTFDRQRWRRVLTLHIVASIALTLVGAVAIVLLSPLVTWMKEPRAPFLTHVFSRTFMDIQRYWYVLMITQAFAYYGKYQERELASSQLEAQLARAQLEVLKIQLEPHFLFNTLNSIAALARQDGAAAENMTLQLADLLRISLDAVGVHEVPLHQELLFLQKYIDIQQMRFRDRLRVETEIDSCTLETLVPNLILQPLVENAIRHGINPRRGPGLVQVIAWRDHDDVWLEIRDNGVGLARGRNGAPREGVGLRNTRGRLQQLYSHDHALVLEDVPGGGCSVKIRVPHRSPNQTNKEIKTDHVDSSVA